LFISITWITKNNLILLKRQKSLNDFKNYAAKDSINYNLEDAKGKELLEKQIKTLTARQIWRTEGLYEVSNPGDETVQKALQVITATNLSQVIK